MSIGVEKERHQRNVNSTQFLQETILMIRIVLKHFAFSAASLFRIADQEKSGSSALNVLCGHTKLVRIKVHVSFVPIAIQMTICSRHPETELTMTISYPFGLYVLA